MPPQTHCPATGKVQYASGNAAGRALASLRRFRKHERLTIYRCPHCGSLHLGRPMSDSRREREYGPKRKYRRHQR